MNNQLRDRIRDDPETRRRIAPALMHWKSPRFVLHELNTRSPKDGYGYWPVYWYLYGYIPEEYVIRILEEEDI